MCDGDMSRCRVLQNSINFVEVRALEGDIIPVPLERLLRHLLHTFDKLVSVYGQLDLEAHLLWLSRVALT